MARHITFFPLFRKALLLATGIVVTGGTAAAYMHSRNSCTRQNAFGHSNGAKDYKEQSDELIVKENNVKKGRQKRGNLRPLQVLAAILISRMGTGAINIFSLVAIAVFRTAVSNRLAKVQGFLFRAAFLRRVPVFIRLIIENIFLCFLLSALSSTSKYITGTLSLRFRKILTKVTHAQYFQGQQSETFLLHLANSRPRNNSWKGNIGNCIHGYEPIHHSATSVDVEEHLYKLATNSGITVITSSQRPALIPFHSVELRLIDGEGAWELRTIEQLGRRPSPSLFVRCYLPAGNKQRVIKLDTHQISPKSNLIWDQTYSLNCSSFLQQVESIILELWKRILAPFLSGSKLVGIAEVTWKECVESRNMKIEKWVSMIPKSGRVHEDSKPETVHIAVKFKNLR